MTNRTRKTRPLRGKGRIRAELAEAAGDLAAAGLMTKGEADKITLRMLGPDALGKAAALTAREITAIREDARMSQAVFGRLLDVSVSTIGKWERGEVRPTGPARRL